MRVVPGMEFQRLTKNEFKNWKAIRDVVTSKELVARNVDIVSPRNSNGISSMHLYLWNFNNISREIRIRSSSGTCLVFFAFNAYSPRKLRFFFFWEIRKKIVCAKRKKIIVVMRYAFIPTGFIRLNETVLVVDQVRPKSMTKTKFSPLQFYAFMMFVSALPRLRICLPSFSGSGPFSIYKHFEN